MQNYAANINVYRILIFIFYYHVFCNLSCFYGRPLNCFHYVRKALRELHEKELRKLYFKKMIRASNNYYLKTSNEFLVFDFKSNWQILTTASNFTSSSIRNCLKEKILYISQNYLGFFQLSFHLTTFNELKFYKFSKFNVKVERERDQFYLIRPINQYAHVFNFTD